MRLVDINKQHIDIQWRIHIYLMGLYHISCPKVSHETWFSGVKKTCHWSVEPQLRLKRVL